VVQQEASLDTKDKLKRIKQSLDEAVKLSRDLDPRELKEAQLVMISFMRTALFNASGHLEQINKTIKEEK
jgi:hypothetical protein